GCAGVVDSRPRNETRSLDGLHALHGVTWRGAAALVAMTMLAPGREALLVGPLRHGEEETMRRSLFVALGTAIALVLGGQPARSRSPTRVGSKRSSRGAGP